MKSNAKAAKSRKSLLKDGKTTDSRGLKRISEPPNGPPSVDFSGTPLGKTAAAQDLADWLCCSVTIQKISLKYCSLGGQGLGEIARVLSTSAFVTELDLSVNEIDANGLRLFVESLQAARSPLRTLSLAGNDLGDSGSAPCAVLLERNSLTSLDLACCGIGRAGAARIATALWRNTRLASLDLEENNCGPIGAARIAAALSVNTGLRSLNLCSNTIGDEGAAAIGSVLGCNSTLEKLFLARNGLTRDGAGAFAGAVETNFSLKQVTLVEPDSTEQTFLDLRRSVPLGKWKALLADVLREYCPAAVDISSLDIVASGRGRGSMASRSDLTSAALSIAGTRLGPDKASEATAAIVSAHYHASKFFPALPAGCCCSNAMFLDLDRRLGVGLRWARDAIGRSVLHWISGSAAIGPEAARGVAEALVVGLKCDVNDREPFDRMTPITMSASTEMAAALATLGASMTPLDMQRASGAFGHLVGTQRVTMDHNRHLTLFLVGPPCGTRGLPAEEDGLLRQFFREAIPGFCSGSPTPDIHGGLFLASSIDIRVGRTPVRLQLCDGTGTAQFARHDPEHRAGWISQLKRETAVGFAFLFANDNPTSVLEDFHAAAAELRRECQNVPTALLGLDVRTSLNAMQALKLKRLAPMRAGEVRRFARSAGITAHCAVDLAAGPQGFSDALKLLAEFFFTWASRSAWSPSDGEGSVPAVFSKTLWDQEFETPTAFLREIRPAPPLSFCQSSAKVLVFGSRQSGKTLFLKMLQQKDHDPEAFDVEARKTARGTAIQEVKLDLFSSQFSFGSPSASKLNVMAFDFPGKYEPIQELFISSHAAVYVLVIDASLDNPSPQDQLSYWLQLLLNHTRGPQDSCRLMIVLSKVDQLVSRFRTSQRVSGYLKAREELIRQTILQWPRLKTLRWQLVTVSSKTGLSIELALAILRGFLNEIARIPLAIKIPGLISEVNQLKAAGKIFVTVDELTSSLPNDLRRWLLGNAYLEDALEILHDNGTIVADVAGLEGHTDGKTLICLQPGVLARAIGVFTSPGGGHRHANAIVRMDEALQKLSTVEGFSNDPAALQSQLHLLTMFMQQVDLCFSKTSEGGVTSFVFPSLRPSADLLTFPTRVPSDHTEKLLELACCSWHCTSKDCEAKGRGRKPLGPCPVCNCEGTLVGACSRGCPECMKWTPSIAERGMPDIMRVRDESAESLTCDCVCSGGITSIVIRRCTCVVPAPETGIGFVCATIRAPAEHSGIMSRAFAKAIVQEEAYLAQGYCVFSNAAIFRDILGNICMASLQDSKSGQACNVAVRGRVPGLWQKTLPGLAALGVVEPQCPLCVQADVWSALELRKPRGLPAPPRPHPAPAGPVRRQLMPPGGACPAEQANPNPLFRSFMFHRRPQNAPAPPDYQPQKPPEAPTYRCILGHVLTPHDVAYGAEEDLEAARCNALWSPRWGSRFFTITTNRGLWTIPPVPSPTVKLTVLSEREVDPSRSAEYLRARNLFFSFLGRDQQAKFELTSITFAQNDALEAAFSKRFLEMASRGLGSNVTRASSDSVSGGQRAKWILDYLGKSIERISGNGSVNYIVGWHGTIQASAQGIVNTNFWLSPPIVQWDDPEWHEKLDRATRGTPESKAKDPGYFGRGVYFTQLPSYGARYAVASAQVTQSKAIKSGQPPENTELCLVASWVLLGRPYPVTEKANPADPNSLIGRPCKPGFDSHYCVLSDSGDILTPFDPLVEGPLKPGPDEICVFDTSQILPRYLFTFRPVDQTPAALNDAAATAPPTLGAPLAEPPKSPVGSNIINVLWVNDKVVGDRRVQEEITLLQRVIASNGKVARIITVTSTDELRVWVRIHRGQEVAAWERSIRVITNGFRPGDGGTEAADRVVRLVFSEFDHPVPVLIYTGQERLKQVQYLTSAGVVFITASATDLMPFTLYGKLP